MVQQWGLWDVMRSDYGGENKLIQTFQLFHGKKVKMGSSVHNTTVERWWSFMRPKVVDVYREQITSWVTLFDVDDEDPLVRGCIQRTVLPHLQESLQSWKATWNSFKSAGSHMNRWATFLLGRPSTMQPSDAVLSSTALGFVEQVVAKVPFRLPFQRRIFDPVADYRLVVDEHIARWIPAEERGRRLDAVFKLDLDMTLEILRVMDSIPRLGDGDAASDDDNIVAISESEDLEGSSEDGLD
jgi:hypothetical protein